MFFGPKCKVLQVQDIRISYVQKPALPVPHTVVPDSLLCNDFLGRFPTLCSTKCTLVRVHSQRYNHLQYDFLQQARSHRCLPPDCFPQLRCRLLIPSCLSCCYITLRKSKGPVRTDRTAGPSFTKASGKRKTQNDAWENRAKSWSPVPENSKW